MWDQHFLGGTCGAFARAYPFTAGELIDGPWSIRLLPTNWEGLPGGRRGSPHVSPVDTFSANTKDVLDLIFSLQTAAVRSCHLALAMLAAGAAAARLRRNKRMGAAALAVGLAATACAETTGCHANLSSRLLWLVGIAGTLVTSTLTTRSSTAAF